VTTTQTLKHFIEELEADLNEIADEINNEIDKHTLDDVDYHIRYKDYVEKLNDEYEEKQEHLSNLKTLLSSLLAYE